MARTRKTRILGNKSRVLTRMLDELQSHQKETRAQQKQAAVPEVGVLFMIGNQIYAQSTPITEASAYGKFLIEDMDHVTLWPKLQQAGLADRLMEYDECPRGRITWDKEERKAHLFLDRCILKKPGMVMKIIGAFHLPRGTVGETDLHYRCPACLRGQNPLDGPK